MALPSSLWFGVAALGSFVLAYAHGVCGQRAFVAPLRRERLYPSAQWGDEDMTSRIFAVSWHMVTVVFVGSGIALLLLALGRIDGTWLPRSISVLSASFLVVGFVFIGPRSPVTLRRPFALMVLLSQLAVCIGSWLGTR